MSSNAIGARITVIASKHGTISKVISEENGGLNIDSSRCALLDGAAKAVTIDSIERLAGLINSLKPEHALVLGSMVDVADGEVVLIKTKDVFADAVARYGAEVMQHTRTRSKGHFFFADDAAGILAIDVDLRGAPPAVRERIAAAGGVWAVLCKAAPALARAAHVWRASTSAGISNKVTGQQFAGSDGLHFYVPIRRAADGPRAARALFRRLWLILCGWGLPSAAGTFLLRSLVDVAVVQACHILFEGGPVLEGDLVQDPVVRQAIAHAGEVLDSETGIADLTEAELERVKALVEAERERLGPELKQTRERWIRDYAGKLEARGVAKAKALRIATRAAEGKVLLPDFAPEWLNPALVGMTIRDVLAEPETFYGEVMADPHEGSSYMLLKGHDGRPFVHSFAHGRTIFRVAYDADEVRALLADAPADDVAGMFAGMVHRSADLTASEQGTIREELLKRLGKENITKNVFNAAFNAATAAEEDADEEREGEAEKAKIVRERPHLVWAETPAKTDHIEPVMALLNRVLGKSEEVEPPMRDVEGRLTRALTRQVRDLHRLNAASANAEPPSEEEKAEQAALGPPEHTLLTTLDYGETARLIERYIYFHRKAGKRFVPVRLPKTFVTIYQRERFNSPLPMVMSVVTAPLVLPSGEVVTGHQLDRERHLLFKVPPALAAVLPRPE